jgi:hypothetical protein
MTTPPPPNILSWLKVREVKPPPPKSLGAATSLINQTDKFTFTPYPKDYTFSNLNIVCNRQQYQSLNRLATQEIWVQNQLGLCYFARLRTPSVLTLFGIHVNDD